MSASSGPQKPRPAPGTPGEAFGAPRGPDSDTGGAVREDHVCDRLHTTDRQLARCHFKGALVSGMGPYAVVIACGPRLRVQLRQTHVSSGHVMAMLDTRGCGVGCTGQHRLAVMSVGFYPAVVWAGAGR